MFIFIETILTYHLFMFLYILNALLIHGRRYFYFILLYLHVVVFCNHVAYSSLSTWRRLLCVSEPFHPTCPGPHLLIAFFLFQKNVFQIKIFSISALGVSLFH